MTTQSTNTNESKHTHNFPIDREVLGEPKALVAYRDGDRDLTFVGWLLGEGEHGTGGNSGFAFDWTRGTVTRVYLTTGGNLVVAVRRWSNWQGERERRAAAVCRTIDEVLDWLRADNHGELGVSAKAAIDDIDYEPLTALANEEVA